MSVGGRGGGGVRRWLRLVEEEKEVGGKGKCEREDVFLSLN